MSNNLNIGLDLKTCSLKFAGIGRYTINLVEELLKNQDISYTGFISPQTDLKLLEKFNLHLAEGKHRNIHSTLLRSTIVLPFESSKNNLDIFHSMDNSSLLNIPGSKVKKIATIHDLIIFKYPELFTAKHRMVVQFLISLAAKTADHIITVSESTKYDLLKQFPKLKEEKITVTHLAADQRFQPVDKNKIKDYLKKNNLPQKYFLSVGTLEPRKNLARVISAFREFKKNSNSEEISLFLVGGKGWLKSGMDKTEDELKKEGIIPLGFVADEILPLLYSGALAFVYPSLYEGFGLPVVEAMSCGCPVITSNHSSLPEVAGEAAIYVDPYSKNEIKSAFDKIANNLNLTNELSLKSLNQAKKFNWGKAALKTESIYKTLY